MCKSLRLIGLVLLFFLIVPLVSQSATIEVMNTNDSGPGSLRQAIADADAAGGDDIVFNPSLDGELFLVNSPLLIDKSLTITGLGKDNMAIQDNNVVEETFIVVENVGEDITVIIQELEIRNSNDDTTVSNRENLTINDTRFRGGFNCVGNTADSVLFINDSIIEFCQFGIINSRGDSVDGTAPGTATISRTDINGNDFGISNGGGSFDSDPGAVMTIYDTAIRNNTFGLVNSGAASGTATGGTVNMFRTSVVNNETGISNTNGGFASAEGAVFNAQNSTIAGNTGSGVLNDGGAFDSSLGASFKCVFCTIANNGGTGVVNRPPDNGNPGSVDLDDVIIANNGDQSTTFNCDNNGDFTITNSSKVTDSTCIIAPVTLPSLELGPLQNNGGFTDTIAIGATSSAKDVVPEIECMDLDLAPLTNDQRQLVRPFNSSCDVGAFEYQPTGRLTIAKASIPTGEVGFEFLGTGFPDACNMMGTFFLDDNGMQTCTLPLGVYEVEEQALAPQAGVNISCTKTPSAQTLAGVTIEIADGDDVTCTFTNDTRPFILNPIFPGVASNPNSITVEQSSLNGDVAFVWGFVPGSTTIGGPTCPGIELGISDLRILGITQAGADQMATLVFYIPLNPAFQKNPVLVQAVDISTCRISDVVTNIILSN